MKLNFCSKVGVIAISLSLVLGCSSSSEQVMTIASQYGMICNGHGIIERHFICKRANSGIWQYAQLFGFDYVPGYEYVVMVCDIDGMGNAFRVETVLSKVEKTSTGIPEYMAQYDDQMVGLPCDSVFGKE